MENLIKLNNDFKRVKIITIISLISLMLISLTAIFLSYMYSNEYTKRIYVINKNEQFQAIASDLKENRPVEIIYDVKRFHELFFSLAPDAEQIEENMKKAFYLCDESSKNLYENLKEQNFYNDIVQGNVVQKIQIDSVTINSSSYPYEAICYAKLIQNRATAESKKTLITLCSLVDMPRSINSPNGLLIRNFKILKIQNEK